MFGRGASLVVAASDKQGKASLQLMMLGLVATGMEQDNGPVGDRASCAEFVPLFLTLHEGDLVFSGGIRSTTRQKTHRPWLLRCR